LPANGLIRLEWSHESGRKCTADDRVRLSRKSILNFSQKATTETGGLMELKYTDFRYLDDSS